MIMKSLLVPTIFLASAGLMIGGFVTAAEMPSAVGHTDLHRGLKGNNYGVYPQSRRIGIITGLAPVVIMERNGQITTVNTVMGKTMPLHTYRPSTEAEVELYRRYFP